MHITQLIEGLHHVTATVDDAQQDLDFYTGVLGLRLVKQTVNFDNHGVYHFYYGNRTGEPGSIMTTFPYRHQGVRQGQPGTGQVMTTSFAVPLDALAFWRQRLASAGIAVTDSSFLGQQRLVFNDPAGLQLALVATAADPREPWSTTQVPASQAIRGLFGVTLSVAELGPTSDFLIGVFGLEIQASEGNLTRFVRTPGLPGQVVDVHVDASLPRGRNGIGTVHHVAWRIPHDEALLAMRTHLVDTLGMEVTEVKDRQYFHSIYFRMPGGVLFEVATVPPGFTVNETEDQLGQSLQLPPWEEPNRAQITAMLPPIVQ